MPPTGGAVPLYESPDKFYQDQRNAILNSNGFKMAMAGAAITILMLILLVRNYLIQEALDDARETREVRRVLPYPPIQVPIQTQVKQHKIQELREVIVVPEVKHITHELTPVPLMIPHVPRMSIPPRAPVLVRTFKYPPPYEAFNKK